MPRALGALLAASLCLGVAQAALPVKVDPNSLPDVVCSGTSASQFQQYLAQYAKSYSGPEYTARCKNYISTAMYIAAFSQTPEAQDFTLSINQFADWSAAEIRALSPLAGMLKPDATQILPLPEPNTTASSRRRLQLSTTVDYRTSTNRFGRVGVTPVVNQGSCGSCWAFATAAIVESQNLIKNGISTPLTKQQFVDCDSNGGDGCDGGDPYEALLYVQQKGLRTAAQYPYTGKKGTCGIVTSPAATVSSRGMTPSCDETALMTYLDTVGPIAVAVAADCAALTYYTSGILSSDCLTSWTTATCESKVDHAVVLVGYGTSSAGVKFWTIRNSWGTSWGEAGYFRVTRGVSGRTCSTFCTSFYGAVANGGISNPTSSQLLAAGTPPADSPAPAPAPKPSNYITYGVVSMGAALMGALVVAAAKKGYLRVVGFGGAKAEPLVMRESEIVGNPVLQLEAADQDL